MLWGGQRFGCKWHPSLTNVSQNEVPWIMHPLYDTSHGRFVPVLSVPCDFRYALQFLSMQANRNAAQWRHQRSWHWMQRRACIILAQLSCCLGWNTSVSCPWDGTHHTRDAKSLDWGNDTAFFCIHEEYFNLFSSLFNTASYATTQIPRCRRMLVIWDRTMRTVATAAFGVRRSYHSAKINHRWDLAAFF